LKAQCWDQVQLNHKPQHFWQEAVIRWLQETTKRSIDTDKYILNWLRPYLDNKCLDEIDKDVIEHIIQAKLDEGCTQTRVNRVTTLICSILNKARKEWEWIDNVPHIRKFPELSKRIRWLTREEANRLMHELPDHLEAMARFSLATGLRESNVTLLEWNQIDLQRKVCWIHPDQVKTGKAIGVPLNQSAVSILTQQIGNHPIRVFTYKGSPVLKASTRAWRNCLKRVGIENFRWHDLRHTWASWHVQAGTPLHILQELGGWASFQMVQKYAHLAPEHLANYADRLDDNWHNSDTLENVIPIKNKLNT
jgi:integrase